MAEIRVRNVDDDLWRKVKDRADFEGRTLRVVLLRLLKAYAEHGYRVVEAFHDKKR